MKKTRVKGILCSLFLIGIFLLGCTPLAVVGGIGIGVAAFSYIKGEYTCEYNAEYDKIWEATIKVLYQIEMQNIFSKRDALEGIINATRFDKTPVYIKVKRKSDKITIVSIRIGLFGDREASQIIHGYILKRLDLK